VKPGACLSIYETGDWTGSGVSRAGIFRSGTWLKDLGDHNYDAIYQFGGVPGDMPVTGKW
jgi:hypothetical protein